MKRKQLKTKLLTTDHHCQIKKYMRGEEEDIYHQFHVWHFCKSVKIKLLNAAKKKACEDFKLWIKSICNHFWNEILLKEKWKSIVFLIQSKHWTGNSLYHQCSDPELSRADESYKNWLSPKYKLLNDCNQLSLIK